MTFILVILTSKSMTNNVVTVSFILVIDTKSHNLAKAKRKDSTTIEFDLMPFLTARCYCWGVQTQTFSGHVSPQPVTHDPFLLQVSSIGMIGVTNIRSFTWVIYLPNS